MVRSLKSVRSLAAIAAAAALVGHQSAKADPFPTTSNFQGLATNAAGRRLPDGPITVALRYYSAPSGGTMYYAEQFLNVPVSNGLFAVSMGSGAPLSGAAFPGFTDTINLENIVYVGTTINTDPEMSPRKTIQSAPYAVRSLSADLFGGLPAGNYLNTSATAQAKAGALTLTGPSAAGTGLLTAYQTGAGSGLTGVGNVGVAGFTATAGGGVFGRVSTAFSPSSYGVSGVNDGPNGFGVSGSVLGNGASTGSDAIGVSGVAGFPSLGHTFNYAAGVRGQSAVGDGVQGASSRSNGVYGYGNNVGMRGEAHYDATLSYMYPFGVWGTADAGGTGVVGDSELGGGVLGRGTSGPGTVGRSETGIGVYGISQGGSGPSTGVEGDSGTGIGVRGNANAAGGTGVMASGHGTGSTALQIDNGPLKVSGANPTALTVIAPTLAAQTWFYFDNPLTNGDPNAIIIVTANVTPGGAAAIYDAHPVGVFYDPSSTKWIITNVDGAGMPSHAAFNVLIIKK